MIKVLIILSVVLMSSALRGYEDSSSQYSNDYSQPIPYSFGYDVNDNKEGLVLTRKESGDGSGSVKGSYSYRDNHGIERRVEYIADKGGFRAVVKTNEPGTAPSNPADVEMLSDPIIVESRGYSNSNSKSNGQW